MKIGIVGCGYVGQATAIAWKQKGHEIAVTTRRSEQVSHLQQIADHVHLLESPESLNFFIDQQEALLVCVAPDRFSDYSSTYLHTTKQIADQTNHTPSLRHILYTSSTSIYGDHFGGWVNETTPLHPLNENGKILCEAEQILLKSSSEDLKVCILRLGEIYGPGREIENRLRRMQHLSFPGIGDAYTNLIHLTDIVRALDFSLQHQFQGIYNLCNDHHVPRATFYESLCQKEQIPPIKWDPTQPNFHGNKRVSNEKLKGEGFTFLYPIYK